MMGNIFIYVVIQIIVFLTSERTIIPEGADNFFSCEIRNLDLRNITWWINGTRFTEQMYINVSSVVILGMGSHFGILNMGEVNSTYNSTVFECEAIYSSGSTQFSNRLTVFVQGMFYKIQN